MWQHTMETENQIGGKKEWKTANKCKRRNVRDAAASKQTSQKMLLNGLEWHQLTFKPSVPP